MKMSNLKLRLILLLMVSGLFFTSCEDSNSVDVFEVPEAITEEETIALVESDDIADEVTIL